MIGFRFCRSRGDILGRGRNLHRYGSWSPIGVQTGWLRPWCGTSVERAVGRLVAFRWWLRSAKCDSEAQWCGSLVISVFGIYYSICEYRRIVRGGHVGSYARSGGSVGVCGRLRPSHTHTPHLLRTWSRAHRMCAPPLSRARLRDVVIP